MVTKNKVEVFFRANFQIESATSDGIKQYIEEKLIGIKVKSIEVCPTKKKLKAIVTSNLVSILTGTEELAAEDYPRGTSFQNTVKQSDDNIELEKIKKEFTELKAENGRLEKEVKEDKNSLELLQAQLYAVNKQLEAIDMERCSLEGKNENLEKEVEKLRMKVELNEDIKSIPKGPNEENIYMKLEAYEDLLAQKQKQFADEKRILQDNLSAMTLRLIDEQEKVEHIRAKTNQVDEMQRRVEVMTEENTKLLKDIETRGKEIEEKTKELVVVNERVQILQILSNCSCQHGKSIQKQKLFSSAILKIKHD